MNTIERIHASDMYGFVVETGCSTALSGALMDVAGASNTVYFAKQPYSKDYEKLQYGSDFGRSVSMEFVQTVLEVETRGSIVDNMPTKVNFGVVASWQISSDEKSITHGWYAVGDSKNQRVHCLHFTYPQMHGTTTQLNRNVMLHLISNLGVNIVEALMNGGLDKMNPTESPLQLDQAYIEDKDGQSVDFDMMIEWMEQQRVSPLLVFENNIPVRLAELLRTDDEFIIQKGSFNPLHHQHIKMMQSGQALYKDAHPVFMISTYRWDKPHIDVDELRLRIKAINDRGYTVMILRDQLFYDAFRKLDGMGKKYYFVMGSDTINRILQTDQECGEWEELVKNVAQYWSDRDFKFLVHNRIGYPINPETVRYGALIQLDDTYQDDGTSSTKIRSGEIKNKLD